MVHKKKRMLELGDSTHKLCEELLRVPEAEIIEQLERAFCTCQPKKQRRVLGYRIDLFLEKPKIAIECDEHGHSRYDHAAEQRRQLAIQSELGCTFLRFDPYEAGFCVFDIIAKIVDML